MGGEDCGGEPKLGGDHAPFPLVIDGPPIQPRHHQSIVRAVGIVPGVPEPCCVPDKMSSLGGPFPG